MYYLDEIMDRTFDSWSTMLGANNNSFWASMEIEMKPTPEPSKESDNTNNTPEETPDWEAADSNESTDSTDATCESNPVSDILHEIAGTVGDVLDEINPFTEQHKENDE